MANIKGITVEIGGDTTKLSKALEGVNKTIKDTQSQLKDVEKLLKLDPKNTELLTQKQETLATKISATKEKLEALKTASEQAAKTADKYDAWKTKHDAIQKEIDETKEHLEKMKKQAEEAEKQLAEGKISQEKYDSIQKELKETEDKLKTLQQESKDCDKEFGNPVSPEKYDALQREIIKTEQELKKMAKEAADANTALTKMDAVGKTLESVGTKMANTGKTLTTHVTAPIVALGTAAVKTTADFDAQMSKVSAISGATGKDFDTLREKAREMGAKTRFSATEAGQAFEYMSMAGWKTGDMLDGIEGIMNLAAASGEDLATTSDIVTDALTAFGLSAKDSGHFADILAAASSNANTNVSMMGETFKYAAPIAGALGYSAEDTALAIGLMANAGIKSSQAGTSLRKIMSELNGDIKISGKSIGDVTIATTNADGSMRSFNDILMDCRAAFANLTESEKAQAAESLVGKNAMSGFLAIMNASEEDVNKLSSAIENCDGASADMAATMQDNLSGQITILKSALQELAIQIGDALMPIIRKIVTKIQDFVVALQGMDEGTRNNILRFAAFAAAIGPVLLVVGKLTSGVGSALQSISSLGKGILTFVNEAKLGVGAGGKFAAAISAIGPAGLAIIAVVAALTAAFVYLWNTNEDFHNKVVAIWDKLKERFQEVGEKITEAINKLGFDFRDIGEVISTLVNDVIAPLLIAMVGYAADTFGDIVEIIGGAIQLISGIIIGFRDGDWSVFWSGLGDIVDGAANLMLEPVQWLFDMFGIEIKDFDTEWGKAWEGIKSFFTGIWEAISSFFAGVWSSISTTVTTVVSTISTAISTAWNTVKGVFETVWNAIAGTVSTVWETIKNVVQVGILFIQELFSAAFQIITLPFQFIWQNCKDTIIEVWDSIKEKVSTVLDWVKDKISTAWNAVKGVFEAIWNPISSFFSGVWDTIKTKVSDATGWIGEKVKAAWGTVKNTFSSIWDSISSTFSGKWDKLKTTVSNATDKIKSGVSSAWDNVKSKTSSVWDSIKESTSSKWGTIKDKVGSVAGSIKDTLSSKLGSAKDTVTSKFDSIKEAISNKMTSAKDKVSSMIDKIKQKFNFSWSLPKLKLPHVRISGKFSLDPPSVPSFSISWYKKAMEKGMILNAPTIFGIKGNSLLAGGEAGSEAVVGTQSLMEMIQKAVTAASNTVSYGGVNINVYGAEGQDESVIAMKVADILNHQITREGAVWA